MNALPLCILKNEHKKTRSNTRRTNLACVTCSIVPRGLIKEVVVVQAINCMPITIMFRWNKKASLCPPYYYTATNKLVINSSPKLARMVPRINMMISTPFPTSCARSVPMSIGSLDK